MKTLGFIALVCIGLTFSTASFADCYTCSSRQGPCQMCTPPPCNSCANDCANKCACTEPSCGRNPCLSKCDCCKAFGNVGGFVEE